MTLLALGPQLAAEAQDALEGTAGLGLLEVVELTLAHDPSIALVENRLTAARGALLSAAGAFDPLVTASAEGSADETPLADGTSSESETLLSSVDLSRLLRSGLFLEPGMTLERTGSGAGAVNVGTVSFTLRQPLLRGRGREVVAAGELAAERELEASRLDLEHRIAERLLAVVSQYWRLKAAMLDLEVLRTTEERTRELLETTRRLIAADVTPAAELVQLEAELASREVNRIAGEQTLFEARQALGREIGLEPRNIAGLPLPDTDFPKVEPDEVPRPEARSDGLIDLALARRADLRAARERQAAVERLLAAAENDLKPQLDLVFTPSYSGLSIGGGTEDFFSPLSRNVPGLSTTLGFRLSWPTWNRRAEGDRIQSLAAVEQSALVVELAVKTIGADVPAALDAVRRSAQQLERLGEAVGYFEKAVDNEIKKLRAGSSTLIDVITQRNRLTAAQQQQVSARLALALALLDLRFQTGTLVEEASDSGARAVTQEHLTTLPF